MSYGYAPLYPLRLTPALVLKVWGGRRLNTRLNIPLPDDQPYGEAWIMHDSATVNNGALRGQSVADVLRIYGRELIGVGAIDAGMPLLAKFLDASDWLSLQVHPNDDQARTLDGEARGKTEAWYVIDAEPGSQLAIGIQPGNSREDMADAIAAGTLEGMMVYATVSAGDVLSIAPGTIHALGPGILIYEIQQSSDLTYRLYDYGRPRELHVEKGLQVAHIESVPPIKHTAHDGSEVIEIVSSPYFTTLLRQMRVGDYVRDDTRKQRFHILTCIEGEAVLEWGARSSETRRSASTSAISVDSAEPVDLRLGETILVPASVGEFRLRGRGRVLQSFQP